MHRRFVRAAALPLGVLLLTGCTGMPGADVESLLRAPRLSGEASAVQKALNSYLGSVATLKYPATGEFLSPFAFGDWDGDGTEEAAVLYTAEASGANVWLAILEPSGEDGWRVSQQVEWLSGEVESINFAHLRDADSQQLLVGYDSAQGDRYMCVYLYTAEETIQEVNRQTYTNMLLADMTGRGVEDNASVTVTTADGAIGVIETGFVTPRSPFTLEVHGTEGSVFHGFGEPHLRLGTEQGWEEVPLPENAPHPFVQWVDAIDAGTSTTENLERARDLTGFIVAANASAR